MAEKKEYNFYDYIAILSLNKKKIIIPTVIIGLVTAFLVFFVIEPVFLSTGTVQTSTNPIGIGSLLGGSGLPDIGGLESLSGTGSKELAVYEEILLSRRCIEATIIKFNLMEEYESKYLEDAVKLFREEVLEITVNRKASTMTIGIYDTDPVKAKEMTAFMISQLNQIYTELSIQNAKNNREFLEDRFNLVRKDLRKVEDSLKVFQELNGVAPDVQIKAAAQSEIEISAQIAAEEVKLDLLKKILTPDQAEIKAQNEKIAALNRQLFEIQNSTDRSNKLNLKGAPEIMINYLRLQRDLEIQNKILATILPLYEQAKIEENKETPTVLVLDSPNIPERKKKPKRSILILISLVVSAGFLSAGVILKETFYKKLKTKIEDARQDPTI